MVAVVNPGSPAEPQELVGRLLQQGLKSWAGEHHVLSFDNSCLASWEQLSQLQRNLFMELGELVFESGREAGLAFVSSFRFPVELASGEAAPSSVWAIHRPTSRSWVVSFRGEWFSRSGESRDPELELSEEERQEFYLTRDEAVQIALEVVLPKVRDQLDGVGCDQD